MDIAFTVNGEARQVGAPETTSLLEVLRNHLGLMGTRYGCGLEQCGCCMVLVDGQPAYACTREVGTVAGRTVTTVEGLGTADKPHPLQQAFLDEQAGQCGYCLSRHHHVRQGAARPQPRPEPRRDRRGAGQASLPLRHASAHPARGRTRRRDAAQREAGMSAPVLPASLVENPRLDRWIRFQPDRTVRIATGKVEIGQGVVTAIGQIAADELDVPLDRVAVLSGDTDPWARRALHDVFAVGRSVGRLGAAGLRRGARQGAGAGGAAAQLQPRRALGGRRPIPAERRGDRPGLLDASRPRSISRQAVTGTTPAEAAASYKVVGQSVPRLDLPAKVSGAAFVHDFVPEDLLHARTLRQPSRGATLAALDEAAIRRAAKGELQIVREANFVAFVSPVESVAQAAAAAAPAACDVGQRAAHRSRAAGGRLAERPAQPRTGASAREPPTTPPKRLVQITVSRPYIAHASMAPSCALAEFRDGHLTVWSHGQGMHPLRKNLAAVLGLPTEAITARHLHGAGCYGHNGADDAALDAALIALRLPGQCIRLQWRREEEFGFEPVGPAMLVTLHVDLDERGRPADWTTEIWSPTHVQRPGSGSGYLLASEALANPPPEVTPTDPPEARGGGGTRNAVPLYDVPAHRILHHLVLRPPVRTSALRGLGALPNVYAIESLMDELAARAGEDPVAYRLSILSEPRARRADRAWWRSAPAGRRADRPARAKGSASPSPATRTAPPMPRWRPPSPCRRP